MGKGPKHPTDASTLILLRLSLLFTSLCSEAM